MWPPIFWVTCSRLFLHHEPVDHPQPGRSHPRCSGVSGGNFVFVAGKLPVTAMAGFIGNLQLIIFLGILYVVAADELIDVNLLN